MRQPSPNTPNLDEPQFCQRIMMTPLGIHKPPLYSRVKWGLFGHYVTETHSVFFLNYIGLILVFQPGNSRTPSLIPTFLLDPPLTLAAALPIRMAWWTPCPHRGIPSTFCGGGVGGGGCSVLAHTHTHTHTHTGALGYFQVGPIERAFLLARSVSLNTASLLLICPARRRRPGRS